MLTNIFDHLYRAIPRPQIRAAKRQPKMQDVKRIILFGRHPSPTSDYYFGARLAAPGMPPHQYVDVRDRQLDRLDADGAFIIICRYASASVLDWLDASRDRLAGVALFLDDDIPAVITSDEASIRYKLSLLKSAIIPLRRLNRQLDMLWISTPRLAATVASAQPRVLPPAPAASLWDAHPDEKYSREGQGVTIAYHATGIHVKEHDFLKPIIVDVLSARPGTTFEVFADRKTAPLWKAVEGVTIRKALPWPEYVKEGAARRIDIMLVPLAPTHVNSCRSPTKRIDVVRFGAAGIFSESEAYGGSDTSGEIRLPYDQVRWRHAILKLVDQPLERAASARASRAIVERMSHQAASGLQF